MKPERIPLLDKYFKQGGAKTQNVLP